MAINRKTVDRLDKRPRDQQPQDQQIDAHQKIVIDGEVGSPPKPIRKIVDLRNEPQVRPGEMLEDDKFTQT